MKPCSFCGGYGEVLDGNIISKCPECAGYPAIYGEDEPPAEITPNEPKTKLKP